MKTLTTLAIAFGLSIALCAQPQFTEIHDTSFGDLKDVYFQNDEVGVMVEDDYIHFTDDGGNNWRTKHISGMKAGACGVSIYSGDTVFVVAESKHQKVHYFKGFHSNPIVVHEDTSSLYVRKPSVCFVGQDVYVAAGINDSSIHEPGYLYSPDHGDSWQLRYVDEIPIGYKLLASIRKRNQDTLLVSWLPYSPSGHSIYIASVLWSGKMQSMVPNRNVTLWGGYLNSVDGLTMIGSVTLNRFLLHRGDDLSTSEFLSGFADPLDYYWYRGFWLYSKNEFLHVETKDDPTNPHIEMASYYFEKDTSRRRHHQVVDTSVYTIPYNRNVNEPIVFSQTHNYLYFTVGPSLFKVDHAALSQEELKVKRKSKFDVLYHRDGPWISLSGLMENEAYRVKVYSLDGVCVMDIPSPITSADAEIDLSELVAGSYILSLESLKSGKAAMQKVMRFPY